MKDLSKAIGKNQKGAIINLSVKADAKKNIFPSGYNQWRKSIEIDINAAAKDNKANVKIITTLSDFFDISHQNIYIISGKKNKEKTVLIKGVNPSLVINKLEESLNGL